jgi:PEP-CTERM motif
MKILKWFAVAAGAVAICLASGAPVFADAAGSLDVSNCSGGGMSLAATSITWLPAGTVAGTGCIATGAGTNLTYSGGTLGPGNTGNIQNVTAGGGPIDQFMAFQGTSLDFVLTSLGPGLANTNCAALTMGQSCSVFAGSPFVLTDLGPNTIISFTAGGTVTDGGISDWSGAFSTQVNFTAAQIQTTILGGGAVTSTQSGQFSLQSVPEPSSLLLLAFGLCSSVGLIRRKRLA